MKSKSVRKTRLQLLHQYYIYTGFYKFISSSLKKAAIPFLIILGALWFINEKVMSVQELLSYITETYPDYVLFSFFFLSECVLGLIPPELFIAWSYQTSHPILYVCILSVLSYGGGIVSYGIGSWIARFPKLHTQLEGKLAKHVKNARKWGGFLILVGALLPVPFSLTSIAAGVINFRFWHYLGFALFRFLRIFLYGAAIFNIM